MSPSKPRRCSLGRRAAARHLFAGYKAQKQTRTTCDEHRKRVVLKSLMRVPVVAEVQSRVKNLLETHTCFPSADPNLYFQTEHDQKHVVLLVENQANVCE